APAAARCPADGGSPPPVPRLEPMHARLRQAVPFYAQDRLFAPDIEAALQLVLQGAASQGQQDLWTALWAS
nr:hypothetical protein [Pseudoxanthomonas sp.]